jgi:hypothetical protein
MSLNIRAPPLASNDDFEEDLLLMDTDGINLQLDEQQPIVQEEQNKSGSFSIIEVCFSHNRKER